MAQFLYFPGAQTRVEATILSPNTAVGIQASCFSTGQLPPPTGSDLGSDFGQVRVTRCVRGGLHHPLRLFAQAQRTLKDSDQANAAQRLCPEPGGGGPPGTASSPCPGLQQPGSGPKACRGHRA